MIGVDWRGTCVGRNTTHTSSPTTMQPPPFSEWWTTIQRNVTWMNESNIMLAIAVFFLNIGSKYVTVDLSATHESIISSTLFRRFIIFMIFFSVTRNVWLAMTLTAVFVVVGFGLFDDRKRYSLVRTSLATIRDVERVSYAEYRSAKATVARYETQLSATTDARDAYDAKISKIARDNTRLTSPRQGDQRGGGMRGGESRWWKDSSAL